MAGKNTTTEKKNWWNSFKSSLSASFLGRACRWVSDKASKIWKNVVNFFSSSNANGADGDQSRRDGTSGQSQGNGPKPQPKVVNYEGFMQIVNYKTSQFTPITGEASDYVDVKKLKFTPMTGKASDYIKNCKNEKNKTEYLVYVRCDKDMYRIIFTCEKNDNFYINSLAKQNESIQHMNDNAVSPNDNMQSVKALLGLKNGKTSIKVDEISKDPIIPKVASPTQSKPKTGPAGNNNDPQSPLDSLTAKPQAAGNGRQAN